MLLFSPLQTLHDGSDAPWFRGDRLRPTAAADPQEDMGAGPERLLRLLCLHHGVPCSLLRDPVCQ